jgi:hypothetical protein
LNLDKKYFGLSLKWWAVGLAVAVGVGLWWRSHQQPQPQGKQIRRPMRRGNPKGRRVVRRVSHPIYNVRCPAGYHRVGHRCIKNKAK